MSQLSQTMISPETENGEEESLIMGAIAGFLTAIICAVLWAVITKVTQYQIGWMAVGVGFFVGYTVRFAGRGHSIIYGITGAILALLGCVLGNFLAVLLLSADETLPLSEILNIFLAYPVNILTIMKETFQPIDLLFYGIALYEGFRFSMISSGKKPAAVVPSITP
jgi:hypothetical protein